MLLKRVFSSLSALILSFGFTIGSSGRIGVGPERPEQVSSCPVILWVDYPKELLDYKSPVRFEVRVDGAEKDKQLKYTWFVSAGRILSGQGTNAIVVSMKDQGGRSLTATVVVCGLPDECENVASSTAPVA